MATEDVIACDVINPDHIDVEFDSVGGLKASRKLCYELIILPLRRPELFSDGKLLGLQKGVLLCGPPTIPAKAIAKESGAVFINAFEVGIPDEQERVEILKVILKGEKVLDDINFDSIARMCDGYTGSDLQELCKKAAYFLPGIYSVQRRRAITLRNDDHYHNQI
ncbi:hypothetical protein ACH5RR_019838 [Cinchona calisaya]|uniref:AAA ATPase AAA+ lid domain-containing protein n=1 Tax=Cinchona calisaya TaxID=153742 RepID=A0ABD2ZRF1_9GENT